MKFLYTCGSFWYALVGVCLGLSQSVVAEEIQFRFNPPLNSPAIYEFTDISSQVGRVSEIRGRMRINYRKYTGGHWREESIIKWNIRHNGSEVTDAWMDAFTGIKLTSSINKEGELWDIDGLSIIMKRLRPLVDSAQYEIFQTVFTEERLVAQAKTAWDDNVLSLKDQSVKFGEAIESTYEYELETGETATYTHTLIPQRWVSCREHELGVGCVRLDMQFHAEGEAYDKLAESLATSFFEVLAEESEPVEIDITELKMTGKGVRVVNPATLQMFRDEKEATVTMKVRTGGDPVVPVIVLDTTSMKMVDE